MMCVAVPQRPAGPKDPCRNRPQTPCISRQAWLAGTVVISIRHEAREHLGTLPPQLPSVHLPQRGPAHPPLYFPTFTFLMDPPLLEGLVTDCPLRTPDNGLLRTSKEGQ